MTVYEVGYWWTIVVEAVVCVVCLLFLLLKFYHLGFIQFWKKVAHIHRDYGNISDAAQGWNRFYLLLVALFISDLLLRGFPSIPPYSKPLRPFLVSPAPAYAEMLSLFASLPPPAGDSAIAESAPCRYRVCANSKLDRIGITM